MEKPAGSLQLKGVFHCDIIDGPHCTYLLKAVVTKLFKCTLDQRIFMQKAGIFEKKHPFYHCLMIEIVFVTV